MKIKAQNDIITFMEEPKSINSGAIDVYNVDFEFSSEWDGLTKTAIILQKDKDEGTEELIKDNKISIPYLKDFSMYSIGIIGFIIENEIKTKQISTNLLPFWVDQGAGSIPTTEHELPPPDVWEQYLALLNNKVDKVTGKGLSANDLTNQLKANYDDTVVKAHTHPNKTIIDNTTASYTTTEKTKLANIENYDDTNIITELDKKAYKTELPTKTSQLTNDSGFITSVVNDLTNYYLKSQTYSKTEVNSLIGDIVTVTIEVVEELPANPKQNIIYFIIKEGTAGDIYNEYMWVNNTWELIGTTEIDLTGYATEEWVGNQISNFLTETEVSQIVANALSNYYTRGEVNAELSNKVDKVEGKGLSERDFSSTKDDKLSNIEANADKLKYTIIPENPDYGDIIQYIGEDTDNFKHGHFYEYVQGNPISANIVYESETITNVSLDDEVFATMVDRDWVYNFRYLDEGMGAQWLLGQEYMFDLIDYGIIYEGEPEIGDIITVNFETEKLDRWVEVEVQSGMQFLEMPIPNAKLNEKIIQFVGEKFIDENFVEYIQGRFYKCSFQYKGIAYEVDSSVDEFTEGTFYTRRPRGIPRYNEVILPDEYIEGTTYYKRVTLFVYAWEEVSTGQVIQYTSFPQASEENIGTIGQFVGVEQHIWKWRPGCFYQSTLVPAKYEVDSSVDENTVGTYFVYQELGSYYMQVTLPEQYSENHTYYNKISGEYYDWRLVNTSPIMYGYIYPNNVTETVDGDYIKVEVTVPNVKYEDEINIYPLFDNALCIWWKENFIRIEYVYKNGFSFILKENLPAEYTLKYTRVPSQYEY